MHLLAQNVMDITRFTGEAFISGLWQGTVLVLGIAFLLRLQPRISPALRFTIWTCAFALAAALPLFHLRPVESQATASTPSALQVAPVIALTITGLWLSLSAVRLARLAWQGFRIRRIWSAATPIVVEAETQSLLHTLGRRAALCISQDIDSPCVIGFFAPRLLIPAALLPQLTEADLHQIVLHECTHLHRYDDWINLAQKIGLALFPLNPALLWVDRRLGLERELACDAAVVARTAAPFDYARCLTRLAEHRLCSRRLALALSAWGRQSELLRRVQQLLSPSAAISSLQARLSVALTGIALIAGSLAMVRAPRLVAFSAPIDTPTASPVAAITAAPIQAEAPMVPVIYRPSSAVHAVLLSNRSVPKSAQSVRSRIAVKSPTLRRGVAAERPAAHYLQTSASNQSPSMTDSIAEAQPQAHTQSPSQPRPVYLLSVDFSSSYAAVPFGNGWLIVQL